MSKAAKKSILFALAALVLIGFAVQGFVGAIGGIFLTTVVDIVYGTVKRDKKLVKWSAAALMITIFCIMACYGWLLLTSGK